MVVGFGDKYAKIRVYIENKPKVDFLEPINDVEPLSKDKLDNIVDKTGNHWRKIFNVFAKLIHEKEALTCQTWQQYRDKKLLTKDTGYALVFSPPNLLLKKGQLTTECSGGINIVMGKTYATKLNLAEQFDWVSPYFAIHQQSKSIICPYFDYRQLSNIKISQLVKLINKLD